MVSSAPVANIPVQQILLRNVSWESYESLLADHVDSSVPHFTYDRGMLEIVSPSTPHEEDNRTLARIVEIITEEWMIEVRNVGSMTFKRKDLQRGFEPDTSFYIQHEEQVRGRRQIQLSIDPPPDLLIEIEVTNPAIAKLPIYAEVGVLEVWRSGGERVTILVLDAGHYCETDISTALSPLSADVLTRFVLDSRMMRSTEWVRSVRAWAREQAPVR
ncbi:MAG TPA: Uma2 family endonuclease [Thermomicrobiales bacterium]|nr:Uma2 family endonuclease [Thermomicrobiales bacterium]